MGTNAKARQPWLYKGAQLALSIRECFHCYSLRLHPKRMVLTTFTLSVELLSNEQTLGHKLLVQLQDMSVKVTTEVAEVEAPKVSVDDSGKVSTLPTSVSTSRRHMPAPCCMRQRCSLNQAALKRFNQRSCCLARRFSSKLPISPI